MLRLLIIVSLLFVNINSAFAGNFVDQWLANSSTSSTSPSYFEGQKRGYFYGGSFQMRWQPTSNEPLITVEPPKVKAGCGGIDVFGGGISLLDKDMLVKKFENILQNADSVAFDMALNTLCEVCSKIIHNMEAVSDYLNGLSLDECKASKMLVAKAYSGLGGDNAEVNAVANQDFASEMGWSSSWTKMQQDWQSTGNNPPYSPGQMTVSCPANLKTYLMKIPSGKTMHTILANVAEDKGIDTEFVELIRGLIGDVVIVQYDAADPGKIQYMPMDKCAGNPEGAVEIVKALKSGSGQLLARKSDGSACYSFTSNLSSWVSTKLTNVATAMKNKATLSNSDADFVKNTPGAVYTILKSAISAGHDGSAVVSLTDPVADIYAYGIIRDVLDVAFNTMATIEDVRAKQTQKSLKDCKPEIFEPAFEHLRNLSSKARPLVEGLSAIERNAKQELSESVRYAKDIEDYNQKAYSSLSNLFSPAVARRAVYR